MVALNRRDFFRTGGVITAGVALWPACTTKMLEEASYRFFTNDEAMSVIALCEQIIPGDDHFGGATDAGVILYIDRQLSGTFKEDAPVYREHLKLLQTHCKNEFGKAFQKLFSDEQIDVMERMESNTIGAATWERPANFFHLIRSHTMQGFYGSPLHGGNKDYMSFDMLGLEYPLNIGQNRYSKPLHEL
jgi:gluconate 2-dehydrogenase gamma chain